MGARYDGSVKLASARHKRRGWLDVDGHVQVPRSLLQLVGQGELWLTHAFVLAHVHYRAALRHTVDVPELVALTGFTRQHCSDVLRELVARGWLDERRRPAKPLPTGKAGFLKVEWSELRAAGTTDSALFAQLKSLPTMDVAQLNADGAQAPTGMLASMLGLCRDTVRASFRRLTTGDTVRSRLAQRRGRPHERRTWIALRVGHGVPSRVRLESDRVVPSSASSATSSSSAHERAPVPPWTELLAMAKAATSRPPSA